MFVEVFTNLNCCACCHT